MRAPIAEGGGYAWFAISVPGARGFMVDRGEAPLDAFLVPSAGEFAHLHPEHDGSLHLACRRPSRPTRSRRAGPSRTPWPASAWPAAW